MYLLHAVAFAGCGIAACNGEAKTNQVSNEIEPVEQGLTAVDSVDHHNCCDVVGSRLFKR